MKSQNNNNRFIIGLVIFTTINLIQSIFFDIHYDEAYYWGYSHFPDWAYFDHPPMVAWLQYVGRHLFTGTLGIRFLFICISTVSMILLWKMVKTTIDDPVLFWAMVFSITMFIPYTFLAIPDIPLLFFTLFFLDAYQLFLKKENILNALFLGLTAALMIFSKYNAFLIFFFVFLSNFQLIKKKHIWLAVLFAIILTLPHWIWQINHGLPSIQYQLIDNHRKTYSIWVTLEYMLTQPFAVGVFSGWLILYAAVKSPVRNLWKKALQYCFIGIFTFFILVTFSGDINMHWTLVAYLPMFILAYQFLVNNQKWHRIMLKLGLISFIFFFLLRGLVLIAGKYTNLKVTKIHLQNKEQYEALHQAVGNFPVVTQTTYAKAALYAYYSNQPETTYGMFSGFYHITQFDFYPIEDSLQGKTICYLAVDSTHLSGNFQTVQTNRRPWYIKKVENFRSYNRIKLQTEEAYITCANREIHVPYIRLTNPYKRTIRLNENPELPAHLRCYVSNGKKWKLVDSIMLDDLQIRPGQSETIYTIRFHIPDWVEQGEHRFFIGLNTGFFQPVPSHFSKIFELH